MTARAATALTLTAAPLAAWAQAGPPAAAERRASPAVTAGDALTLGAATVAALALMRVDERVARWSQRPDVQSVPGARPLAAFGRTFGDPGALALGGATYLVGLARRDRAVADVGLHTAGAIVTASVVTGVIKAATGRARPYVTGDTNARSFAFGRGLRGGNAYQSFPSGHATAAFAFAASLSAEGRRRWPRVNRATEPLAYTAASVVALSRIYHNRHWASDVLMGSAIGFVAGRAVVRFQHDRPANALDGRLLPPRRAVATLHASPLAPTVAWTVRF